MSEKTFEKSPHSDVEHQAVAVISELHRLWQHVLDVEVRNLAVVNEPKNPRLKLEESTVSAASSVPD